MTQTRRAQDKREAFYLAGRDGRRNTDVEKEIQNLISEARVEVAGGSYAPAVWRLVDAAGLCMRLAGDNPGLIGWDNPTGRGFILAMDMPDLSPNEQGREE